MPFFYNDRKKIPYDDNRESRIRPEHAKKVAHNLVVRDVPNCKVINKGVFQKELRSEIQVISSSNRLWQVLLEHEGIIPKARSLLSKQQILTPEQFSYALTEIGKWRLAGAKISRLQNEKEIGWKIRKWIIPGLAKREKLFQLVVFADGMGVKLIQHETFSGLLVPLMGNSIRAARGDVQLCNLELRDRAQNIS